MSHATKIIQAAAGGTSGLPDGVASFQLTTSIVERGMEVASNGSLFYVPNYVGSGSFHVYDMSTPYDVTSASRNLNKEFGNNATMDGVNPVDLAVNPAGTIAWTTGFSSGRPKLKYTTSTPFDFSSSTPSTYGISELSNGMSWGGTDAWHVYRFSTIRQYDGGNGNFETSANIGSNIFHATWADNGSLHIAGISPASNSLQYRQASTPYNISSLGAGAYTSIELLDDTSLEFVACSYAESGDVLFVLDQSTDPSTVYTFTKAYLTSIGMPF